MFFVGIDLAWSTKNGSGVSIFKMNKTKSEFIQGDVLYSDEEILNYIKEHVEDSNAHIAIDAPLLVPNEEGRRLAEVVVGNLFRKYDAGAHPANRKRLSSWTGSIRGEDLTKLLERNGFTHDPLVKKNEKSRKVFEVYPHPSMVVLFNLERILRYKNKPGRDYDFLYGEFKKYQNYLKKVKELKIPKEILDKDVTELRGKALKNYEDLLDSIFCAYIAYYYWNNPKKCEILGNMKEGYILTPIHDEMRKQLKEINSQKNLSKFT